MKTGADALSEALRETTEALDEIREELTRIGKALEEIVDILKRLPEAISGAVSKEFLELHLGQAHNQAGQLRTFMQSESIFRANLAQAADLTSTLETNISLILRRTGGSTATGFFLSAPLVGVWTRSFTMVQKALGSPLTVFGTKFHKQLEENYLEFFGKAEVEYARLSSYIDGILVGQDLLTDGPTYEFDGEIFSVSDLPFIYKPLPGRDQYRHNVFIAQVPRNNPSFRSLLTPLYLRPRSGGQGRWTWFYSSPDGKSHEDPRHVAAAHTAFYAAFDNRGNMAVAKEALDELPEAKAKVIDAMTPPDSDETK